MISKIVVPSLPLSARRKQVRIKIVKEETPYLKNESES